MALERQKWLSDDFSNDPYEKVGLTVEVIVWDWVDVIDKVVICVVLLVDEEAAEVEEAVLAVEALVVVELEDSIVELVPEDMLWALEEVVPVCVLDP